MTDLNIEDVDRCGTVRTAAEDAGAWDPNGTRRDLLRQAGLGGAGLAAGGTLLGAFLAPAEAFAQSASGPYSRRRPSRANDLRIANFALTLEYLEAAFYATAVAGGALQDPDIRTFADTLAQHEAAHVDQLKLFLRKRAVSAPGVDFGDTVTNQDKFLRTSAQLEPVGTSAYAGAGMSIRSPELAAAALSILPVEARHAAWAATLLNLKDLDETISPAPRANDVRATYRQTIDKVQATGFVKGNFPR